MDYQKFRERFNLLLYNSKDKVLFIFKILSAIVSITAMGAMVYYFGYPQTDFSESIIFRIIEISLAYYFIAYLIRIIYNYNVKQFLRDNWFESILMLIIFIEGVSKNLFGELVLSNIFEYFGLENFSRYTIIFIQFYFFIILINKALRANRFLPLFKLSPSELFAGSFIFIIVTGTLLLMMPEMTISEDGISFLDALFMSTSTGCVTGLVTFDVSQVLSFKGHFVLLLLMKVGGFNVVAFASFITIASKFGVGVKQHDTLEDFTNKDNLSSSNAMLFKVFLWGTIIEITGAFGLYIFKGPTPTDASSTEFFSAIFHSISSFNNAGITLFSDGFFDQYIKFNYPYQIIISFLMFFGALGFLAIFDMFSINKLRQRMLKPWKGYDFSTKIALYFSLGIFAFGFVFFFILEYNNTLSEHGLLGKIVVSIFQSATTRNAGLNSVDISALNMPTLFMFIVMMFIGASSSSTGGGIKTSSFALIWASVVSTIKNQKNIELFKRTINNELVFRAFSIFLFFIIFNSIGVFILTYSEAHILAMERFDFSDLVFEVVSALSTTGLSSGITPYLSDTGKLVIIFCMFIGRIGTLTVAFMFGREIISRNYKYPSAHTMVG